MVELSKLIYLTLSFLSITVFGKPHIVFFVVDDLGRTDHSMYVGENGTDIPTPNLKKLSDDGIRLDNYYTQTVCSPTRSSFLTGLFPFRTGMQHSTTLTPGTTAHLPLEIPTLPELLKLEGYETSHIGKWHLGAASWRYTPTGRGFDEHFGYLQAQVDYYDKTIGLKGIMGYDFFHNQKVSWESKGRYSLDQYMDQYEKVISKYNNSRPTLQNKSKHPLFLYFAHQTVHVPIEARTAEEECDTIENKFRREYCSMIVELDRTIQVVIDKLKDYEMWDDTLFLLSTDNGGMTLWGKDDDGTPTWPASVGSNYPLRGGKTTMFEGGVRATALINGGKNVIKSEARGTHYKGLMHAVDFAAIAIEESGSQYNGNMDGINLLPTMMATSERELKNLPTRDDVPININYFGKSYTAIRFGRYKLIIGSPSMVGKTSEGYFKIGAAEPIPGPEHKGYYYLFDLEDDPYEKKDISKTNSKLVTFGKDLIRKYMVSGYKSPQRNLPHIASLPMFHNGTWAPFLCHLEESQILSEPEENFFQHEQTD